MLNGIISRLREVDVEEANLYKIWVNDPFVTQFITHVFPITLTGEKKWIESVSDSRSDVVFVIEAIQKDQENIVIGTVGLHHVDWINREAEFGIVIGDKGYWEGGYGTEAARMILYYSFNSLNLRRIYSAAYAFNIRSIALHNKLGFTKEGISRKALFKNGSYHDIVRFGMFKEEFLNKMY